MTQHLIKLFSRELRSDVYRRRGFCFDCRFFDGRDELPLPDGLSGGGGGACADDPPTGVVFGSSFRSARPQRLDAIK